MFIIGFVVLVLIILVSVVAKLKFQLKDNVFNGLISIGIVIFVLGASIGLATTPEREIVSKEEYEVKVTDLCAIADGTSLEGSFFIARGKFEEKTNVKYVVDTEYGKQVEEAELGKNDYILEDSNQTPCILEYYAHIEYKPYTSWEDFLWRPFLNYEDSKDVFLRRVYVVPDESVTGNYSIDFE